MEIILKLTDECNFGCRYCFHNSLYYRMGRLLHSNALHHASAERISDGINSIADNALVFITGGEPFLHPDFIRLCRLLSRNHLIDISTNLSCDVSAFIEAVSPKRVKTVQTTYHPYDIEKRCLGEIFLQRLKQLKKHGFNTKSYYVLHPEYAEHYTERHGEFAGLGFDLRPKYFIGSYKGRLYPESHSVNHRKLIRDFAGREENETLKGFDFRGNMCRAGMDFAWVDNDGSVKRCFGDPVPLGNLLKHAKLLDSPRICRAEVHYCPEVCLRHHGDKP